jgi:hypothetical protein
VASPDIVAAACREFVARHFSVAKMADRYLEVYDRALMRSSSAPAEVEA